jgi:hypothetical protein
MPTRTANGIQLDYSNVLVAIFELMLRSGVQAGDLLPVCVKSLGRAQARCRSNRVDDVGGLVTAALVLDAWHRNRRYLTARGKPRPVRLLGPTPSVEALVRLQKTREPPSAVARRLRDVMLVVRCGKALYQPAGDAAVISAKDPLILQHAARALSTLLETVGQNISSTRRLGPLIERFAEVPDLPSKHVKAFKSFTQAQGRTFLRTVNDWLESRRVRHRTGRLATRTVRAGIHTYAYVVPKRHRFPARSNPTIG